MDKRRWLFFIHYHQSVHTLTRILKYSRKNIIMFLSCGVFALEIINNRVKFEIKSFKMFISNFIHQFFCVMLRLHFNFQDFSVQICMWRGLNILYIFLYFWNNECFEITLTFNFKSAYLLQIMYNNNLNIQTSNS